MRLLTARSSESELMDRPGTPFAEFHHCLQSLETINILTFAYYPTLRWIKPFLKETGRPVHILDAGCGGGDMLRRIEKLAMKFNCPVMLTGVDLDPMAKRSALTIAWEQARIRYVSADIFDYKPVTKIDIVICSLFTHHLSEDQLVRFLRWADQNADQGWFINDLHRHWLPYYFIKAATGIFSRNRLIRNDAPLSVARSLKGAIGKCCLKRPSLIIQPR